MAEVGAFLILAIIWNVLVSLWNSYASGVLWEHSKRGYEKFIAIAALTAGFAGMFYAILLIFSALEYLPVEIILGIQVFFIGPMFITLGAVFVADGIRLYRETKSGWILFFVILNSLLTIWNLYAWIQSIRLLTQMGGIKSMIKKENKNAWLFALIALIAAIFIVYGFFTLGRKNAGKIKERAVKKKSKVN